MSMESKDLLGRVAHLKAQAIEVYTRAQSGEATAEERKSAHEMLQEASELIAAAEEIKIIDNALAGMKTDVAEHEKKVSPIPGGGNFPTLASWLQYVDLTQPRKVSMALATGQLDLGRLIARKADPGESDREEKAEWIDRNARIPAEAKQLVENVGASGGFLVPVEFRAELLEWAWEDNPIRARATVLPMRRRQLRVPSLDQTGTAAGQTRQYGGVVASWTEEATLKDRTEPDFRRVDLVAHKLVCYTESSDELLDDSAISLATLLTRLFGGAISWEEEYTFLQGTGAGQPTGVLNANATFVEPRQIAGTITIDDIIQMIGHHQGRNPVWHVTREAFPTIAQLNGPAGNPSYVFIPNAREGIPGTLFGIPIFWTEKLPRLGAQGDILLASWDMYLIGDRQQTTIDTTIWFRFRTDLTSWRAVHRVDGQPWLSQPVTLADGNWQISPFVILGDVAT